MQKKLLCLILFLLLVALLPSFVNAQISSGTDSASSLKRQRVELRQQMKDTVKMKREETKEAIKLKRDEFKAKIQAIKDQRKRVLVERIDTKITNANAKHTDRFTQVLSNLQAILDKISGDTDKTGAQAAIDRAKAAVETQAAKTYTITITDETNLRLNVGTTTSQFRQDLMATHKLVVDAKQAVQALKKDNLMKKEATRSANL